MNIDIELDGHSGPRTSLDYDLGYGYGRGRGLSGGDGWSSRPNSYSLDQGVIA